MKHKHAFLAVAVALLLCMGLLAGCSGADDSAAPQSSTSASQPADTTAPEQPTGQGETEGNNGAGYDPALTGTYPDGTTPTFSGTKLRLTVNGTEQVIIALYDNTAVDELLARLPMENLSFYDLSGIEKPIHRPEIPMSLGAEEPGYDPVTGEMVIYRPWANFTIFYGDFRYSTELVPLGKVESGLAVIAGQTQDFTGVLELVEEGA